jgi:hypothetical protein
MKVWTTRYDPAGDSWRPVACPVIKSTPNLLHVLSGRVRVLDRYQLEHDGKTANGNDVFYATRDRAQAFCDRWELAIR